MGTLLLAAGGGASEVQVNLLLVLACAGVVTLLLSRLRIAAIPAYLLAGILIGPSMLGLVSESEGIEQVGQLALIVLMFSIGMHLDMSTVRKGAASILIVGVVSTLVSMTVLWGVLQMFGLGWRSAMAAAMGLSMSSTAVVLRVLTQRRELQSTAGRSSLGILLVQDLIVIVYLALLPLLAGNANAGAEHGEPGAGFETAGRMVFAIGAVAALIAVGKLLLPRLLREASRIAGGEVMLVMTAAVGLGAATLTAWLGLSAELGAFIAGFLLAGTPFRFQLAGQLAPVRDLFMAVFFTAIGLQVDLEAVLPVWWVVPLGGVLLIAIKMACIAGVSWATGAEAGLSARVGAALAQAGEFSLVVFSVAVPLGLLGAQENSVLVAVVIASLVVTPAVIGLGPSLVPLMQRLGSAPWSAAGGSEEESGPGISGHVIIAGFGPVGKACAEQLEKAGASILIVELNPETVREQSAAGRHVIFGDIANPDVLESAGIEHAEAVVLTLPDSDATMRAVRVIRAGHPNIHIAVRVSVHRREAPVRALGADIVVVEEGVSAVALADQVIRGCDLRHGVIEEPKPATDLVG